MYYGGNTSYKCMRAFIHSSTIHSSVYWSLYEQVYITAIATNKQIKANKLILCKKRTRYAVASLVQCFRFHHCECVLRIHRRRAHRGVAQQDVEVAHVHLWGGGEHSRGLWLVMAEEGGKGGVCRDFCSFKIHFFDSILRHLFVYFVIYYIA